MGRFDQVFLATVVSRFLSYIRSCEQVHELERNGGGGWLKLATRYACDSSYCGVAACYVCQIAVDCSCLTVFGNRDSHVLHMFTVPYFSRLR